MKVIFHFYTKYQEVSYQKCIFIFKNIFQVQFLQILVKYYDILQKVYYIIHMIDSVKSAIGFYRSTSFCYESAKDSPCVLVPKLFITLRKARSVELKSPSVTNLDLYTPSCFIYSPNKHCFQQIRAYPHYIYSKTATDIHQLQIRHTLELQKTPSSCHSKVSDLATPRHKAEQHHLNT